ncbi:MAG: hypothetical protein AAGF55_08900 [Pseudomonadota bacterium]
MGSTLPLAQARRKLALVWFPLSGAIFLLMVLQTFSGAFADQEQRAWGWALPNFLPTLALMASVFSSQAIDPEDKTISMVKTFFFRMAFWISIFYFLILFIVILAPVVMQMSGQDAATPETRLTAMSRSNIFLGPLQSLVVGIIGALFILKDQKAKINVATPGAGG